MRMKTDWRKEFRAEMNPKLTGTPESLKDTLFTEAFEACVALDEITDTHGVDIGRTARLVKTALLVVINEAGLSQEFAEFRSGWLKKLRRAPDADRLNATVRMVLAMMDDSDDYDRWGVRL